MELWWVLPGGFVAFFVFLKNFLGLNQLFSQASMMFLI